ncbi:MAG: transposase [Streptomyces sp.]|uniref:transposase n=1 Tax=Streptomyces sp. TaxID=1931 RepID=UPI0025D0565F|nr:transposase [Streptomyces sp.]MBW8795576.1 transposase [Streptomyces sp.]
MTDAFGAPVSRNTLLRLITSLPDPLVATPRVVGVDEYAHRKGRIYGTVLVDVETRRPVDLLPDREADTSAARLAKHPGIEVVCRDRVPFFAEGATRGAPQALQVADRWHLWHNLGEAAERCVYRHRGCLRPIPAPQEEAEPAALSPWPTGHRLAERTRAQHATIHALLASGHSKRSVARQLGMGLNTILRFSRHHSGGVVHRPVAEPCDQARCLQALPRPALAGGLHQCLETVGGDQRTGLPGRLQQRPRLREQDAARPWVSGARPAASPSPPGPSSAGHSPRTSPGSGSSG